MNDSQFDPLLEKLERARREYAGLVRELLDIPRAASASAEPWSEPLDAWWRRNRDRAEPEVTAIYERLVEHGSILFRLAEQLASTGQNRPKGEQTELLALLETFQKSMGEVLGAVASSGGPAISPTSSLLDDWRRQASALFGIPADPLAAFSGVRGPDSDAALRQAAAAFLNPASVASPRMSQQDVAELVDALAEYQGRFNHFVRLTATTAGEAVSRMSDAAQPGPDEDPRGVRDLYGEWLECCELAYDDLARDDEFADALSALVNSAVRVRAVRQKLADSTAFAMGLPTRGEVRSLSRLLHETRRELRRSGKLREAGRIDDPAVQSTETAVTPENTTRKKTVRKTATKATTRKKKVAKKKTAKKATRKKSASKKTAGTRKTSS